MLASFKNVKISWLVSLLFFIPFSCTTANFEEDTEVVVADENLNDQSEYFVVFGDIQEYTVSLATMVSYEKSVDWIQRQLKSGKNIVDVFEVGDVTWSNTRGQWQLFYDSTVSLASQIPYFTCTGNHDYTWDNKSKIQDRYSTLINDYAHFPATDKAILDYYASNSLENYVARLSNKEDINLLVLEFGPRQEVVQWAKDYVENHLEDRFILLTHEWLTRYGERISTGSYAESQFSGYSSYSTPEEIWNILVKPNDNIICVLCGHNGFSAKLFSLNDARREVPQILFNLQYQEYGGNGLVQLWEFPENSEYVNICAYDTINKEWYMPDSTFVTFKYR